MKSVYFEYNKNELGWVSEPIEVSSDLFVEVTLSRNGFVVVKQRNLDSEELSTINISEPCTKAEYTLRRDNADAEVVIITSELPKKIEYANI